MSSSSREPSGSEASAKENGVNQVIEPFAALLRWGTKDSISVYTLLLTVTTGWLAYITLRSVNLAREEFTASHRPKIIVRFIQPWNESLERRGANVVIVNVGDTPATIFAIGGDLARRRVGTEDGWEVPGIDADAKPLAPFDLKSGKRHSFRITCKGPWEISDVLGEVELCAVGVIQYRDDNGVARETGFLRVLNDGGSRYIPTSNAEDEYED